MFEEIPRPLYTHSHSKDRCKVCRSQLVRPRPLPKDAPLNILHMLFNRGICGAECLMTDYDSTDLLVDDLYEYVDKLLGDIADLKVGVTQDDI